MYRDTHKTIIYDKYVKHVNKEEIIIKPGKHMYIYKTIIHFLRRR